jgi:hypothetical protein
MEFANRSINPPGGRQQPVPGKGLMALSLEQAVEKHPSALLRSSFVIAAYGKVRRIPQDFARLASGCF